MIQLRKFTSPDEVEGSMELDELDFDVFILYLKQFLMDSSTYKVEVKRFWTKPSDENSEG